MVVVFRFRTWQILKFLQFSLYLSSDVKSLTASAGAFCALKTDGRVYCWGSAFAGGGVSSVNNSNIADVVLLVASRSAFAALKSSGDVVCGDPRSRVDSLQLPSLLRSRMSSIFCQVKQDLLLTPPAAL